MRKWIGLAVEPHVPGVLDYADLGTGENPDMHATRGPRLNDVLRAVNDQNKRLHGSQSVVVESPLAHAGSRQAAEREA